MQALLPFELFETLLQSRQLATPALRAFHLAPRAFGLRDCRHGFKLGPIRFECGALVCVADRIEIGLRLPKRTALGIERDDALPRQLLGEAHALALGAGRRLAFEQATEPRRLGFDVSQADHGGAQHGMLRRAVSHRQRGQRLAGLLQLRGERTPLAHQRRQLSDRRLNARQPPITRRDLGLRRLALIVERRDRLGRTRQLLDTLPIIVAVDAHGLDLFDQLFERGAI